MSKFKSEFGELNLGDESALPAIEAANEVSKKFDGIVARHKRVAWFQDAMLEERKDAVRITLNGAAAAEMFATQYRFQIQEAFPGKTIVVRGVRKNIAGNKYRHKMGCLNDEEYSAMKAIDPAFNRIEIKPFVPDPEMA